jgi:hypothetical protein
LGFFSFGKKKPPEQGQPEANTPPAGAQPAQVSGAFVPQPDKARKFFDHAKTIAQTGNYEYALMLYAKAFRFDPSGLPRHEEFYKLAVSFYQSGGKPAGRDEVKELDGPGPIDKFVQAEYVWARDVLNMDAAFKMLETAGKAGQIEFGSWIAPKLLDLLRKQKKQSKSMWLRRRRSSRPSRPSARRSRASRKPSASTRPTRSSPPTSRN